jgi:hypothetical protein
MKIGLLDSFPKKQGSRFAGCLPPGSEAARDPGFAGMMLSSDGEIHGRLFEDSLAGIGIEDQDAIRRPLAVKIEEVEE